jgi:hypothetical protein
LIKPGDIIEWFYVYNQQRVVDDELCYSDTMKQWIPIGGSMLCAGVTGKTMFFLRKEGLFHARVDETFARPVMTVDREGVVPRARG